MRASHVARALWRMPPPDAIVSRSPRAIEQLRQCRLVSPRRKLILEYQYPEWAQLWRSWRERNPQAPLAECKRRLAEWKAAERRRLLSCSGVLYAAPAHRRLLAEAGFSGPADWLPSGCVEPEEDPPGYSPTHDIGYVGALRPENGVHVLMESLGELGEVDVVIAGSGPTGYVERLKGQAAHLKPGQRVEFVGAVAVHAVRGVMRSCRLGVVPISARFGPEKRQYASPLKLVEWCAAGVPLVASAVPSVLQSIDPKSQARAVRPDDATALGQALADLLAHPEERERLRRNAMYVAQLAAFPNRAARIEAFARRPMA